MNEKKRTQKNKTVTTSRSTITLKMHHGATVAVMDAGSVSMKLLATDAHYSVFRLKRGAQIFRIEAGMSLPQAKMQPHLIALWGQDETSGRAINFPRDFTPFESAWMGDAIFVLLDQHAAILKASANPS